MFPEEIAERLIMCSKLYILVQLQLDKVKIIALSLQDSEVLIIS